MKINNVFAAIIFFVAAILSSISIGLADVTVKHSSGETSVPNNPKKVIVFDLASLDNIARLGATDAVIGVPETPMPEYLRQFADKKYEKVGSLFEPNYEKIANLQPDLIIVAGRSQRKYDELAKIAPTIDLTVANDTYLADVDRNVRLLGTIFNKKSQAEAEISDLNESLNSVRNLASKQGNGLVILTTGGKMSAFGPGSRFGLLHSGFGVKPAAPQLKVVNHGEMISPEYILETNPDWLFVIDRDAAIGRAGQSAAQILDNALVHKTKASQEGHIVYLDPQNWYLVGGGLSGLHETADQLTKAFSKTK